MASVNQDFVTFQGDTVTPVFTVKDSAGAVVDISGVTQISWNARRNKTATAVITKTKTGGQITFVTTGTNGQFEVAITAADTALLDGYYLHEAIITDASGSITTVTIGRMQVGLAPQWTYNPGEVGTTDLYTVRNLIGDVLVSDQLLSDPEVLAAISQYSNTYLAAAEACRNISARNARKVDISNGSMRTNYSQMSARYAVLARELEQRGMMTGGATAYVGGISVADKQANDDDTDRVAPQFTIGEFDDYVLGNVGHQTLDQASSDGGDNS